MSKLLQLGAPLRDGSQASMREALEDAKKLVDEGKARCLAIVVVRDDGCVSVRQEYDGEREPCDWLVMRAALDIARET